MTLKSRRAYFLRRVIKSERKIQTTTNIALKAIRIR